MNEVNLYIGGMVAYRARHQDRTYFCYHTCIL